MLYVALNSDVSHVNMGPNDHCYGAGTLEYDAVGTRHDMSPSQTLQTRGRTAILLLVQ